jgi:hypothetical protein
MIEVATTIKAKAATVDIIRRIAGPPFYSSRYPLLSCRRLGERHLGRLLHELVKNSSGAHSDNEDAQASEGKGAHLLSPNALDL